MRAQYHTVSGVARHYGVPPRKISDLFYARKLSDEECPIVNGRRLIPESYLPELEHGLRQHGLLPVEATATEQVSRYRYG